MSEYERFFVLLRMPNGDRAVLLITFALTVLVDLTVAIGVGVTLASLMFMARMAETVHVEASGTQDAELDAEDLQQRDDLPAGVEVFRITGPFFFGVAGELLETLRRMGQSPQVIILRMRLVPLLDASGVQALQEFAKQAHLAGASVMLSGVQAQPKSMLTRVQSTRDANPFQFADNFVEAQALAVRLVEGRSPDG